jgi:hypothetical protein
LLIEREENNNEINNNKIILSLKSENFQLKKYFLDYREKVKINEK